MSGHGNLQFVWDIMLQSDWWKQYGEMIGKSQAEKNNFQSSQTGPMPGSGPLSSQSVWAVSRTGSWTGSMSEAWWGSSSGSWWMQIPAEWWSSFSGSEWSSFPGSGSFGSGFGLGYGLQLI